MNDVCTMRERERHHLSNEHASHEKYNTWFWKKPFLFSAEVRGVLLERKVTACRNWKELQAPFKQT